MAALRGERLRCLRTMHSHLAHAISLIPISSCARHVHAVVPCNKVGWTYFVSLSEINDHCCLLPVSVARWSCYSANHQNTDNTQVSWLHPTTALLGVDACLGRVEALIAKAALLGVDQDRLAQAQQACINRNASAVSALRAAVQAETFSLTFSVCGC